MTLAHWSSTLAARAESAEKICSIILQRKIAIQALSLVSSLSRSLLSVGKLNSLESRIRLRIQPFVTPP
jgi:ribosomal protein L31E